MKQIPFLGMAILSFVVARVHAAQMLPAGVSDIVRQMQEWRDVSSSWLAEATAAYSTNPVALRQLRAHYIEASSIANSLIAQFQLETASRTPMDPRRYEPHVKRARSACEALCQEAKRLLLEPTPKTRGSSSGTNAPRTTTARGAASTNSSMSPQLIVEGVERTVTIAGSIMDMVHKNRKAFTELGDQQRREVNSLLEAAKWTPLNAAPSRTSEPKK